MAQATDLVEKGKEAVSSNGEGNLKDLLVPAAAGAATLAATYAASKVPDLVRDRLKPKLEEEGGEEAAEIGKRAGEKLKDQGGPMGKLAGAAQKLSGGGGGGQKKTRRLPIQRWTDVAAPLETVFEQWTKYNDYPKFMHRVLNVERKGDRVNWDEKIWFSRRHWVGQITDRRKNERIAWKTVEGPSHTGVVTFHRLAPTLTRVMVTMEFEPTGMVEKLASGLRFVKRAVQADLARFKAYVEMEQAKGIEYRAGSDDGGSDDEDEKK
jgi:uncharacterized membrane protein